MTDLDISTEARGLIDRIADELGPVLAYRRDRALRDDAPAYLVVPLPEQVRDLAA